MSVFVEFLIFSTIVALCVVLIISSIEWLVDYDMTKENGRPYGKATFKRFRIEFEKRNLIADSLFNKSFFGNGAYINAGIFEFDKKGMVFSYFGWIRVQLYLRKQVKKSEISKFQKGLWS